MEVYTPKKTGLTQEDGPVAIPLSIKEGSRFHQIQIVTAETSGTIKFRLRTPGSPATFVPVDGFDTETVLDLSRVNRVVVLNGFSDLIEVVPEDMAGTYDVYICSGGE